MNLQKNLFGEMQDFGEAKHGKYIDWRRINNYRKSISSTQCCKVCMSVIYKRINGKGYYKCALQGCSSSESSDIRASCVCDKFKTREEKSR